jgi:hypothetical protein
MATKNIVPRADAEGQLGTSTKGWGKIFLGGTAANIDVNDVSGTNTAGKSLTLISGASTGSGAGGSIVFQTAAAGESGTSVNSHATVLTLDSAKLATFTGGLDIAGAVDIAGDLTLSAGADGALNFSAASSIKILDNSATSLVIEEADTAYMTFVTTNSSEAIKFDKALDINAAVQLDSTLTVGVNDTGYDVKFFGATSGKSLLWDESADSLIVTGTTDLIGTTNLDIVDIDGAVNIGAEVTLADANKIIFNDASQFIHASSDVILNLGATDEIDLTATAIDVNGTMDVSGNATFASNIGIGGGALQSYHANVTSALALDDQSSIFTRSNQLIIANNFYYGASDAGLAIEDGKSSAIFYDRDQLRLVFAASVNAGEPSSLQEKLSVSETGLLTIKDDLIIKTGGTIGGASDSDLLTLAADVLTVAGTIKQSGSTSLLTLNDSNSDSSGSTNIFEMTDYENNVLFKIAQIDSSLNAEINQVVNGSLTFKTNNTAALTLASTGAATFNGNVGVGTNKTSGVLNAAFEVYNNNTGVASSTITRISGASNGAYGGTMDNEYAWNDYGNVGEFNLVAKIRGVATSNSGTDVSGKLEFYTKATGGTHSTSPVLALTISSESDVTVNTGNLVIGTAGKGITFSGTNTPAQSGGEGSHNTLDDYEEGTWTPIPTSTGATFNTSVNGTYTKIGRLVFITCHLDNSSNPTGTLTNEMSITNLPFTASAGMGYGASLAIGFEIDIDYPSGGLGIQARIASNTTSISLRFTKDDNSGDDFLASNFDGIDARIALAGCYEV